MLVVGLTAPLLALRPLLTAPVAFVDGLILSGSAGASAPDRRGPLLNIGGTAVAIHKVIEVIAQSGTSWEDAAQSAVKDAGKTVRNIRSIWIKNAEGIVDKNKIVAYRVNAHITFEVG
jgi:dodecin